jgi:hypothetical protein
MQSELACETLQKVGPELGAWAEEALFDHIAQDMFDGQKRLLYQLGVRAGNHDGMVDELAEHAVTSDQPHSPHPE